MIEPMKRIVKDYIGAQQLADVLFGTVTKATPLEVMVDDKTKLTGAFLIVPEHMTKYEIDVQHTHAYSGGTTAPALPQKLLIRRGLEVGDKVVLVQAQGGSQYVVTGRVVD